MPVSMILPVLDGEFTANMNIEPVTGTVGLHIIGKFLRIISNGHKTIAQ